MGRLHVVAQLGADARVHRPRPLRRTETGSLMARCPLRPSGTPKMLSYDLINQTKQRKRMQGGFYSS